MARQSRGTISVIVPVYNGEKYLAEALRSILAQTLPVAEILVIDDGSTDAGAEIAARFAPPVRCIKQENSGAAAARNLGVSEASGDYLAFLDADDTWLPDKLEKQMDLLANDNRYDLVFGAVEQINAAEPNQPDEAECRHERVLFKGLHVGTMLVSKAVFRKVGFFAAGLKVGEFIDWYARARDMGLSIGLLDQVVMRRRIHETNMMKQAEEVGAQYARILLESLRRRSRSPELENKKN